MVGRPNTLADLNKVPYWGVVLYERDFLPEILEEGGYYIGVVVQRNVPRKIKDRFRDFVLGALRKTYNSKVMSDFRRECIPGRSYRLHDLEITLVSIGIRQRSSAMGARIPGQSDAFSQQSAF